jgi:hypothetical protein
VDGSGSKYRQLPSQPPKKKRPAGILSDKEMKVFMSKEKKDNGKSMCCAPGQLTNA